ncbi:Hypothetical protein SMAX5B_018633 [Scophthalmus maximus]|uniref:Uncharacterized protein n=1 Tax=Scophthalmus maximus TaxID=52904 RepID=A0A2U9CDB2_SCOMX|nr:Hypothetical protein SMAX5B_018633 [Scophthalmus maximus]
MDGTGRRADCLHTLPTPLSPLLFLSRGSGEEREPRGGGHEHKGETFFGLRGATLATREDRSRRSRRAYSRRNKRSQFT